jgi:hypothetical protein
MSKKTVVRMRRTSSGRLKKMSPMAIEKQDAARERQQQALELRKAGATYREIAAALGYYNEGGAKKAVDAVMKRTVYDLAEDIVTLDLQRLDEMQKLCVHRMRTKGDLSQIDRVMRIMERRYMLAGVAPSTVAKIQEAYGLDGAVINNAGVMVVQVGHNSEQDFVKKMMLASGVDVESPEAQSYLDKVRTVKELESGTSVEVLGPVDDTSLGTSKGKVVRSKGKGKKKKIVVRKKKAEEKDLSQKNDIEGGPIEGVYIGGSNKGGTHTHPVISSPYQELVEEEIVDAEIIG